MRLFYIAATVRATVTGISGPFIKSARYLVRETSIQAAKEKFERQVWQDLSHMEASNINYEYTEITTEI